MAYFKCGSGSGNVVEIDGVEYDGDLKLKSDKLDIQKQLPYNFNRGSAVVLNGEIHILGSDDSSCYTKHYKWNGTSWVSVSTLPYDFWLGSAVVYNNEIHILGGTDSSTNQIKHYSISQPPCIQGYLKQGTKIYYPQTSSPITTNLQSTTDGYLVTSNGEVKISVNKEDLEV